MRTKLLMYVATLLLSFLAINVDAQVRRNDWYGGIVFQTDNFVYADAASLVQLGVGYAVGDGDSGAKLFSFIAPEVRYRANVVQKLEFASGKAKIYPKAWGFSHIDWAMRNYGLGYKIGYLPRVSHVGFELEADYIQDGYQVKMPGSSEKHTIMKRMLSGQALMKIRIGKYDASRINFVGEIGGAYNYALHYHDNVIHDKDAVNNGFVGVAGLGITNTEVHLTWTLRYEHAFYDFYDEDFKYNGQQIFEGSKSTFGRLYATMSYSF